MADDSQDKTEDPTGKRLSESRKKGQVPRSKELSTFVTLIVSASLFLMLGHSMINGLLDIMRQQFHVSRDVVFDPATPVIYLKMALSDGFYLVLPILLILLVADILVPITIGGWNFTSEGFAVKMSKLNPLTGLKRIFGMQGVIELIKAIIKVIIISLVAWNLFKLYFDEFMGLSNLTVDHAIERTAYIITHCLLILSATLILLVVIDVPYQLWHHHQHLKMTKQEVRDEAKEADGNPQVKGKIRQMQMQAAQRRMMEAVPTADVIVTNPTHFAVALKYDQTSSGAPILIAKGADLIAAQIRNTALASNVPLVAAPPLARALYYSTELNQEVPRGLFLAVAQVLAYVFQLRSATQNGWTKPVPPTDVQVPDEFKQ